MSNSIIHLREEVKHITTAQVREAFELIGYVESVIDLLDRHDTYDLILTQKKDLRDIILPISEKHLLNDKIKQQLQADKKKYYESVENCNVVIENGGIFITKTDCSFQDEIDELGLWNAQGGNNHVHFENIVQNPVLQMILADHLVDIWVSKFREMDVEEALVVYWDGKVNSTLCIYLMDKIDEVFLQHFDKDILIDNVVVSIL